MENRRALAKCLRSMVADSFRLPWESSRAIVQVYERRALIFLFTLLVSVLATITVGAFVSIYSQSTTAGILYSLAVISALAIFHILGSGGRLKELAIAYRRWGEFRSAFRGDRTVPANVDLGAAVDDLMAEIDDELTANEEDFVRSFVQKGGQGWSGLLDPSFFVAAASISVAAGMSWDSFLRMMNRLVLAVRQVPGPSNTEALLGDDDRLDPSFVEMLEYAWRRAQGLLTKRPSEHSLDEAEIFHWMLFSHDFIRAQYFIRLRPDQYQAIERAAESDPGRLNPTELLQRIIDRWIDENPNASS